MNQSTGRMCRKAGRLASVLLALLALSGSVADAQTETTPDDPAATTISSSAASIGLTLSVSEVRAPDRFWLDESGLHIRELAGIDTVSGDITGTATTSTNIGWSAPCNGGTLVCRGAQVSFQQLTITDENGEWTGDLQLVIDPARGPDTITGILVGRHGNAGQVLYLNAVTERS
ncbi:MAG: hypothetical protein R2849_10645, partial [Thermomicrobiales bacterium]